jgi:hypothetical protein
LEVSRLPYPVTELNDSVLSDSVLTATARISRARNVMAQIVVPLIALVQSVETRNAKVDRCFLVAMVLKVHFAVLHCEVTHYVAAAPHFFAAALQLVKVVRFVAAARTMASKSVHFVVRVALVPLARDCGLVCPLNQNWQVVQRELADHHRSQPDDVPDVVRQRWCLYQTNHEKYASVE